MSHLLQDVLKINVQGYDNGLKINYDLINSVFRYNNINLSNKDSKKMIFCFVYKKGNWVVEEYDPFDLMNRYDELTFGNFDKLEE